MDNEDMKEKEERKYKRIEKEIKKLDKTKKKNRVKKESAWQMVFIKKFCKKTLPEAIQICMSQSRLTHFFNILRILSLK